MPNVWKDNPQLGIWCSNQRADFKRKELASRTVDEAPRLVAAPLPGGGVVTFGGAF